MRVSSLTRRAQALAPTKTSRGSSSRDILAQGEARLRAKLLVDSLERDRQFEAMKAGKLSAKDIQIPETLTAADMLSIDELRELDDANVRERHVRDQTRRTFHGLGTWVASHPEFPASEAALTAMIEWGKARGHNAGQWNVAEAAWEALQRDEILRPDYSKANAARHEQNIEMLRASGLNVQPKNPATMDEEEINQFMSSQPKVSLADSLLIDETPEVTAPEEKVEDLW